MVLRLFSKISKPLFKSRIKSMQSIRVLAVLAVMFLPGHWLSGLLTSSAFPPGWTAHNPIIVHAHPTGLAPLAVSGFSPAQIRKAYGIDLLGSKGAGKTIAIVDAYGNPTMAADLATFNAQFGLPAATLTVAYPGGTPPADAGWALETALDVEWAHAIAPAASILLVAALSNSGNDLLTAVKYATTHGANVVSMSWGGPEFLGETIYDSYFNHANVTYLASSGDGGADVSWPAVSAYVVGVGGTSLSINSDGTYVSESVWSNSYGATGGGTSAYVLKPAYQVGFQSGNYRGVPDVAFDADPNSGVPVWYKDSWYQVGGTSLSAPCWAGLFVLDSQSGVSSVYSKASSSLSYGLNYNDITVNSSSQFSNPPPPAAIGYDLATGLGSPKTNNLVPGTATKLGFTTQPSVNNTAGIAFATQPMVAVQDTMGNTVTTSNSSITLAITLGTGTVGAILSGNTTVNAVNGVATFSGLAIDKAGSGYTLTVTSSALTAATSKTINVTGKPTVDFDRDGETDISIYRPSDGTWWIRPSGTPGTYYSQWWGMPNDVPVPGDYDGDGKTDIAIYRPSDSTWWIVQSSNGQVIEQQWGLSGDVPMPGDYDGDGKTDITIFRPSDGNWWIIQSSNGQVHEQWWGMPGDVPMPGDYDGDGKTDIAIFRSSDGTWWIRPSGSLGTYYSQWWGMPNDVPVPGDYDGDGKTDIAIYRPSDGTWWIRPSGTPGTYYSQWWGMPNDVPVPGDYDGDGKTDIAIYRPSDGTWWIRPSGTPGTYYSQWWGVSGDVPIPNFK